MANVTKEKIPAGEREMETQPDRDHDEMERMRREDPLFIEKTRPDDPSGRPGQLTRDNVNPAIPSGERGAPPNAGGIVDPTSLGMEQGGKAPVGLMQPENPIGAPFEDARYDNLDNKAKQKDRK